MSKVLAKEVLLPCDFGFVSRQRTKAGKLITAIQLLLKPEKAAAITHVLIFESNERIREATASGVRAGKWTELYGDSLKHDPTFRLYVKRVIDRDASRCNVALSEVARQHPIGQPYDWGRYMLWMFPGNNRSICTTLYDTACRVLGVTAPMLRSFNPFLSRKKAGRALKKHKGNNRFPEGVTPVMPVIRAWKNPGLYTVGEIKWDNGMQNFVITEVQNEGSDNSVIGTSSRGVC